MVAKTTADVFTAVKGWITEAAETNWPQDAAVDLQNIRINRRGEVRRRRGLSNEVGAAGFSLYTSNPADVASSYLWRSAGGNSDDDIQIVQQGRYLYLFGNTYPLAGSVRGLVDLNTYAVPGTPDHPQDPATSPCTYAASGAYLYVANAACVPFYIRLNTGLGISTFAINLKVRVFEKLGTAAPGERPTALSHGHEFDLRNGGWPFLTAVSANPQGLSYVNADPVARTRSENGRYPSTTDIFYASQQEAAEAVEVLGKYSPYTLFSTPAYFSDGLRGHYITSVWSLDTAQLMLADANTNYGVSPLTGGTITQSTSERPTAVGVLNGHIVYSTRMYSGVYSLVFSQLVTSPDKAGLCYQQADPTAEEINDLVATDGGTIPIPSLGYVYRMEEVGGRLILLASNGVWSLSGSGDATAFGADSFNVAKITDNGCVSSGAVVVIGTTLLYWGIGGIYAISSDSAGGVGISSMTEATIQEFFNQVPPALYPYILGCADDLLRRVEWVIPNYLQGANYSTTLIYDMTVGGFLRDKVDAVAAKMVAPLSPHTLTLSGFVDETVTDTLHTTVTVSGGGLVTSSVAIESLSNEPRRFRYFTMNGATGWFAEHTNATFVDLTWLGGTVDAKAYLVFPYRYSTSKAGGVESPTVTVFTKRGS